MSIKIKPTPAQLAESVTARIAQMESIKDFDPTTEIAENDKLKKAVSAALTKYREHTITVNKKLVILGMPMIENDTLTVPQKDIVKSLPEAMTYFPQGANGKDIAALLAIPKTDDPISALYWTEGQVSLKKTGAGLQTRYTLATEDDKEEIAADQVRERAALETKKAARVAAKAAKTTK